MPFRRKQRMTRGKLGIKHADSFLNNVGSGSIPTAFTLVEVDAGSRTEAHQSIKGSADTDNTCMVGDLIKYINIHIQASSRNGLDNDMGWMEYAVVWQPENATKLTLAQMGVQTLGETATNFFRNDCLWTGFFPMSKTAAHGVELTIKCPKNHQFLKIGDSYILYCYFRSSNSADVSTSAIRLIQSCHFKAYA